MKNTTIIAILGLFSFGFSQMGRTDLLQPHIFFDDVFPQDEENIDLPEGEKISHFSNSTRTDRTPWEEVSPINGAAINEITVSISDPNIVYATTYGNGVFKSTDAGNTWSPTALINEIGTSDGLAISPIDPNIVFASVYDFGHYTGGVYKTIDGGETWTTIEYFGNTYVRGIFIDPSNPQTIFTYRSQTNYYGYEYSTDGGETWAYNDLYNIDSSSISIYGFHGDPEDPSVVFAHGSGGKVIRILDNGSTGAIEHDVSEFAYILASMDISESNPDHIYLGTSDGFLFTLNGGNSWTLLNEEFGLPTIPNFPFWVYDVLVHPEYDNEIWFQSRNFGPFRSLNGGFTIESMMPPIMDTGGYELAFSSTDGHVLFGSWWKGLWRFDGESWQESNDGLKHQFIRDLFITEDMEIWSGNLRHAVSKSSDNGLSWDNYNTGMESWYNTSMSVDPSGEHALANTNAGPYMTSNSGSDWTNTDDQLDYRMGFYRSNAEPNTVYAAGYESMGGYYGINANYKIMRSENQGQDWDTSLEFSDPGYSRIYEMGVDHGDANNLIAFIEDEYSFYTVYSYNGGQSWDYYYSEYPGNVRSFMRIDEQWYCGTWGDGLFKVTDGDWEQIGAGLPENTYTGQMLFNPLPDSAFYVTTWGAGVYVSYDLGETFEPMNDGLTNLGVISIGSGITDEGLVTMVGTYGGNYKIVQSSVPEISIDPDTLDFGLVYIGYPDTLDLTIFNEGLSALTIVAINIEGEGFTLSPDISFPTQVYTSLTLPVIFTSEISGAYTGNLVITSDDNDESSLSVSLAAESADPPILDIFPQSLSSSLFTGETETQSLTISNNGGSNLEFSIDILNSDARSVLPDIEINDNNIILTQQDIINILSGNFRDRKKTEINDLSTKKRTKRTKRSKGKSLENRTNENRINQTELRENTTRNWQLLANDPQDIDSPYDTENIYYEVTDTSLNFKYEYYEPWTSPFGNTMGLVYIDVDDNTETGGEITFFDNYGSANIDGIDMLVYDVGGFYDLDGVYVWTEDNYYGYGGYFVMVDDILWNEREPNTNVFYFGVSNEFFEGVHSMQVASLSGSLLDDNNLDVVPNEGMVELTFRPLWLSVSLMEGEVESGVSLDLGVTFDATGLFGGDYHALIQINSNDPSTPEFDLPAHLSVTGSPNISLDSNNINFGTTFVNNIDTLTLVITNDGTDVLDISSITIDNAVFGLSLSSATIDYGSSTQLEITFSPLEAGDYNGLITIISNDSDESTLDVSVSGIGAEPPIITVTPDSLYSALFTGETDTQTLTITNEGGSDLRFSINLLNVNTRPHVNIEPGNGPTLSIQDVQDFWNSDHEYSSAGSGRPGTTTPTRTTRSWQLLANDPQDNNSPYDTENIYYEVTDTSLNFKYEYYESWEDAEENTVAIVYLNIDNDTETGETIEEYEQDLIWEGIDAIVYSIGLDDEDGIYLYTEDYYGYGTFLFYEPLAWRVAEDNTNEFSFAVSNELFQGLTSSRIVSWSGSFNYDPDIVPNEGMLDLYFRPAWLSIEPLDSVITVGSALDLSVTFDATGLFGGDYHALIQINSNDPSTPEFDLPAHLSVTGSPNISLDSNNINFGTTFVNNIDTLTLVITNDGTDVLDISSITIDNAVFGLSLSSATIDYGSSTQLEITFSPLEAGDYNGLITIISNDSDESTLDVSVSGIGAEPPIITVAPDSLYSDLLTDEQETQTLTITNTGASDLEWSATIISRRSAIVPTRNGPEPRPRINRDNHQPIILDEMDEDININLWENNSSSAARNPRDFELDIGDLVVSASMDNQYTINCYSIDPDGELSAISDNVQQAIVVEDDGSIIYSYNDCYLFYLMRLNPNETTDIVASFEQWGGDFDIDEEGNIVYITNSDLFLVTPDGVVEQVVSSGFESADAVAVHPLTGDYYIGDTGISSIIRVTPEGETYNIYQDYSNLPNIEGLSFTSTGTLIIADEDAQAIYSFDGTELTIIAQGGLIDEPEDVVVDRDGNYIVPLDTYNGYESSLGSIIKVTPEGEVTYLAQQVFYYIDNIGIYQSRISWLSFQEESGVIPAGSSENINVLFDAAGLFGGDYHAVIQINSNDPSTPEFDLPAHLSVTGSPNINMETDSIDFGVTYTNFGGTEQISIGNNGTDVLEVSSITVDNDIFSLSESNATVGYGDEFILEVEFLPLESGDHSGTITIVSNDSNEPEITIVLVGNSIAPPVINVSTDSLYSALSTGETETQIMTILNNGMSDLEYDINIYGSADGDPYALGFNGSNNYVSFDNQTIQSMIGGNWANEKTISAWIKPVGSSPNISGGWEGDAIYGQASGSGNFFGISRGIIGGEDRIWVYNWDGNDDRIGIEYENFEWVHIALVQDNGVLYGYKNGELIGQVNTGASGTAGYQRIGGGTDNGGYFQGFLDEIRIWSVARTQYEIQSNTSHELSGDEDNLVGYWKFNEGAGTLVNDETANENHGSAIGASWISSDVIVYTSWIGVSPANGIIVPGASSDINLEFNAQGFDAGTYTTSLLINSNDPVSPVINIPATLEIEFLGNDNAGLIPAEFALYQNYPNPFNPITTIRFDIPVETHHNTSLQIFDITGRMVETLVNETLEPGQHEIQWNASQHASGVYFLRMETALFTKTQKMILLK